MANGQKETLKVSTAFVPQGILQRHVILLQVHLLDGLQIKLQAVKLKQTKKKIGTLLFSFVPNFNLGEFYCTTLQAMKQERYSIFFSLKFVLFLTPLVFNNEKDNDHILYIYPIYPILYRHQLLISWSTYLRATDNNANKCVLISSRSFHCIIQASSKVELRVFRGSH